MTRFEQSASACRKPPTGATRCYLNGGRRLFRQEAACNRTRAILDDERSAKLEPARYFEGLICCENLLEKLSDGKLVWQPGRQKAVRNDGSMFASSPIASRCSASHDEKRQLERTWTPSDSGRLRGERRKGARKTPFEKAKDCWCTWPKRAVLQGGPGRVNSPWRSLPGLVSSPMLRSHQNASEPQELPLGRSIRMPTNRPLFCVHHRFGKHQTECKTETSKR